MLKDLSQVVRKPQRWMTTNTGGLWYPESRLMLMWPYSSAPGSPPPLLFEMTMACFSGFCFYSVGSGSFSLCSLVSCEILTGKQPWPHPALLSLTHVLQFHSPASRLPDWLDSKDSLWLQFAYWNYQRDHRSNPISSLLLEFSKVGMRTHVFWIPREVHFIV